MIETGYNPNQMVFEINVKIMDFKGMYRRREK